MDGVCGVMSIACDCSHQVKVWPTHNNLFVPNEFIVCIISQTLRYKRYFKTTFKSSKIFAFVFYMATFLHVFFSRWMCCTHRHLYISFWMEAMCACVMADEWWERESSKWIDKKMKWTHYCRCPLKWTCTQTTSVSIKQLKALLFSKWYMAHLTVGIIEFPTLCWCCCCLKARINHRTT